MILTAAYENGRSIAPKDITEQSILVYQVRNATEVRQGERVLYTEPECDSAAMELCWTMAKDLSKKI